MVFDYMDHDLTGLMDRLNHQLPVPEVSASLHPMHAMHTLSCPGSTGFPTFHACTYALSSPSCCPLMLPRSSCKAQKPSQ